MKQNASKINGLIPQIIIGAGVALVFSAIVILVGPIFVLNESIKPTSIKIIAIITQVIGALVGGLIVGVDRKEGKVAAVLSVLSFYVVLVSCGMLFFCGNFVNAIFGFISCAVGMICALFLQMRKKKSTNRKRMKHRSR